MRGGQYRHDRIKKKMIKRAKRFSRQRVNITKTEIDSRQRRKYCARDHCNTQPRGGT